MKTSGQFKMLAAAMFAVIVMAAGVAGGQKPPKQPQDALDAAIRNVSKCLNDNIPKESKVVILNIESKFPKLSEYIIDEIIADAINSKSFSVVERSKLEAILSEQKFQMSGVVNDQDAVDIGRFFGAQTIISGVTREIGDRYRITIRALAVETAKVQSQCNQNIKVADSPTLTDLINIEGSKPAEATSYSSSSAGSGFVRRALPPTDATYSNSSANRTPEYDGRRYVVNVNTEPQGASLKIDFNGVSAGSCVTPCKVELPEGKVRISAELNWYETADVPVSIKQNNQNVNIKLKSNFGVFEIKPTYSEGIGSNRQWNLTINGTEYPSFEDTLSPGNHSVKLYHDCYDDISFTTDIKNGDRRVFDVAKKLKLKQGVLILSAEKDGQPVIEPVFANGKKIGETPFNGPVPVCAEIGIGENKNIVDVRIGYNQTVRHKHIINGNSGYGAGANVYISTVPPNAEVYVNGRFVGMSNEKLQVPVGTHQVRFVKGYAERTEIMTFHPGQNQTRNVNLR